jgi:NAD-dependent dihydropyrimidine dehydrogenase PreA subunit
MKHHYLKNVVTLKLDLEKCTGCGVCTQVCPHQVLALQDKKAVIIDLDHCMECGACSLNCAFSALTVDSGVGCAIAIINGIIKGSDPNCG